MNLHGHISDSWQICREFADYHLITCKSALLRAVLVLEASACESMHLSAENLENYCSEIDVTW